MKEPYYVITKVTTSAATSSSQAITESELKRRFSRAAEKYRLYDHPWESVLNVLLYGEKDDFPGPEDILKMREERKPSPTPTRFVFVHCSAEWQSFENELRKRYELCPSNAPSDSILLAVLNAVAAVVKYMPIVPKGDK